MRYVRRLDIPKQLALWLCERARDLSSDARLSVGVHWQRSRKSQNGRRLLSHLRAMVNERARCMYCVDSEGTDIEHFRPKVTFPRDTYLWSNLLLCCAQCGRIKGSKFPVDGDEPLLIDPTVLDPWEHLDFDPDTGNLTARYNIQTQEVSSKGLATVDVLHLDRREAVAAGYQATYDRLTKALQVTLSKSENLGSAALLAELLTVDDHGLLPWCFWGNGQTMPPFSTLKQQHPSVWDYCLRELKTRFIAD